MTPLRLELSLQCIACKAPIALNAVSPKIACGSCGRAVRLGIDRWRELLGAPLDEVGAMRDGEQRDASYESPEGVCRRVYRREPARCVACGDAITADAASAAASPSGWVRCGTCQRPILARALPDIAPGVACFVGEDAELAFDQAQKHKEPVAVACPGCGGALPADGTARAFACKFCQATVHLPDDIWARLHPTRPVQPFWAWTKASGANLQAAESHGAVHECAIDGAGNLYLAADDAVYSLDARMVPRWVRADIHVTERMFMLFPDGRIWVHGRTSAVLLACDDGRTLGPGPSFPRGRFTSYGVQGMSVIASMFHEDWAPLLSCVVRVDSAGNEVSLYQPQPKAKASKGFFAQLLGGNGPAVEVANIRRSAGVKLFPGLGTDVFELYSPNFDMHIVARAADGNQRWRQALPQLEFYALDQCRVFAERGGDALLLSTQEACRALLRVGPAGVWSLLSPDRLQALVRKETSLALTPSGEILLFGAAGDIVRLSPDGREVWSNEAAKALARGRDMAAQEN